jgi:xanthine/uracil permease
MSNEAPTDLDSKMFAAVFSENWQNARHIKAERISFMNAYSLISAGVLTLLQSVRESTLIQITLLAFMTVFSLIGVLTSVRLKSELEDCLGKIEAMSARANVNEFVALGQLEGRAARYPKFRWIFPIFYSMTTAGFIALIAFHLITRQ